MSELQEKLEQAEREIRADTGRARAYLFKHLHYEDSNGKKLPRYTVVREDSSGPVIIHHKLMDSEMFWRRVYFDGKDVLFEAVLPGEDHEGYFAPPRQETLPKKRAKKSPARAKKSK